MFQAVRKGSRRKTPRYFIAADANVGVLAFWSTGNIPFKKFNRCSISQLANYILVREHSEKVLPLSGSVFQPFDHHLGNFEIINVVPKATRFQRQL